MEEKKIMYDKLARGELEKGTEDYNLASLYKGNVEVQNIYIVV